MADALSEEDFQYFLSKENNLPLEIDGKVQRSRPADCCVGLTNAGSTCYLNAIVQCLFQSPDFLRALLAGNESEPVVGKLRSLFNFLEFSSRAAVTTTDLLQSFGWSQAQAHEQHDAHEVLCTILDIIAKSSTQAHALSQTGFEGVESDVLQCTTCEFEAKSETSFRSLSVDIPDNLEIASTTTCSFPDLLREIVRPEILDDQNLWECSSCHEKVAAVKSRVFKKLPPSLVFHLKRFRFDPTTKKKRKLITPIDFPLEFAPHSSLEMDGQEQYSLTAVVVHLGTAQGGHYKAYVRSRSNGERWWECNDEHVQVLESSQFDQLFCNAEETTTSASRQQMLENAYLLFYSTTKSSDSMFEISQEVSADNSAFESQLKLEKIRRQLVKATVSIQRINDLHPLDGSISLYFPKSRSVAEFTEAIYKQCVGKGHFDQGQYPLVNCRIRKYSTSGRGKGETFAERESLLLSELGFGDSEVFCFEIRRDEDPTFVEFNPNDMILYVREWTDISDFMDDSKLEDNNWHELIVPGRENATTGALRAVVSQHLSVPSEMLLLVPFEKNAPLVVLDDDLADLRRKYKIFPGHRIVVEKKTDACSESVALHEIKSYRSRVRLHFNNPLSGDLLAYDQELQCRLDTSLSEVKQLISERLGLGVDSFHLRKNEASPQLKDETKSLVDLEISDLSIIHVQIGKGCNPGEHMLRFEIDLGVLENGQSMKKGEAGRYVLLDEIAISEKATILSIKKSLHSQWPSLLEKLQKRLQNMGSSVTADTPLSPHHIRLRDMKGGKVSGPLRDDRVTCRCLLGMSDGRRLSVQVLPNEEIIGNDDLLISIRELSYDKKIMREPQEISIPRSFTVQFLLDKILSTFPHLAEPLDSVDTDSAYKGLIDVAKAYTTGPPLSLKNALKLKWNDPAVVVEGLDRLVDRPPLNLRDGSIIAVRSRADWLRAQARVRSKKESEAGMAEESSASKNNLNPEPALTIGSMPPHPDGAQVDYEGDLPKPSPTKSQI